MSVLDAAQRFAGPDGGLFLPNKVVICSILKHQKECWMDHAGLTREDFDRVGEALVIELTGGGRHQFKSAEEWVKSGAWRIKGRTCYILPAADPKLGYSTLVVYDAFRHAFRPDMRGGGVQGEDESSVYQPEMRPTAREIADHLVQTWAGSLTGATQASMPGIGIIAGPVPTPQELALLRAKNANYCMFLIQQADELWDTKRGMLISPAHREALAELGEVREWGTVFHSKKICPSCGNAINLKATRCQYCTVDLALFYHERGFTPDSLAAEDEAAAADLKLRLERTPLVFKSSVSEPEAPKQRVQK